MTITWQKLHPSRHDWFVWESEPYRIQRSASDLNGTDPYIHDGTVEGVLREVRNAFSRNSAPTVPQMFDVYRFVNSNFDAILSRNGTRNPFDRSVFMELCRLSNDLAGPFRQSKPANKP